MTSEAGSAERTVTVTAGGTASVVFSLSKVVRSGRRVAVDFRAVRRRGRRATRMSSARAAPVESCWRPAATTSRSRTARLGFQEARRIDVTAGKTIAIRVDPPKASVSVNARPWADIMLDGNNVGQTPIANLLVSVGSHEMVFRHPQLGERKQTVTVTAKGPNRIAVDLTK